MSSMIGVAFGQQFLGPEAVLFRSMSPVAQTDGMTDAVVARKCRKIMKASSIQVLMRLPSPPPKRQEHIVQGPWSSVCDVGSQGSGIVAICNTIATSCRSQ